MWVLPDDFLSRDRFEEAVKRLEMNSSPGYPYIREQPSNRLWLKFNGIFCCPIQLNRLWYDVQSVFADQWEHVIRVFIKQEPHKIQKVENKRWRLIMASSLPVQIAWHMLFSFQNDLEIVEAYNIPSQHGIVLNGGSWKMFYRSWVDRGLSCGLDKSAWDWTAPHWLINAELELRFRLGRGRLIGKWHELSLMLYRHMFDEAILMTSDGTLYKQIVPGIVKSGCVNTISLNGHGQALAHAVVCITDGIPLQPFPVSCGDDTIQHAMHVQDLDTYKKFGILVKSVSDNIEFVGHEFGKNGPRPSYLFKHLKKMHYVAEEDLGQYLDSMARMYVHTEYFEMWEVLARKAGLPLPLSKSAYLHWYDDAC